MQLRELYTRELSKYIDKSVLFHNLSFPETIIYEIKNNCFTFVAIYCQVVLYFL